MSFESVPLTERLPQPVAITEVDLVRRRAKAMTRRRSIIEIDLRYHVGGLQVTPAVGEQWFVAVADSFYHRLLSKIPFNAAEMLVEPVEGQVQIGSSGPLELHGDRINAHAPIQLPVYTSDERPAAENYTPGAMIFDLTLGKPLFSTGSGWVDATGTPV